MTSRIAILALASTAILGAALPAAADQATVDAFTTLTRSSTWELVDTIDLAFVTHHPQGLAKIGDRLFLSSVEIIEPTQRFEAPQSGLDRTPGVGTGHLFELDLEGNLVADITIGEGDIYHPGGIDFDGTFIWVPVAEYRPNSQAIIYRVDPATLEATEVFRYGDHVGGVVHNTENQSLHGVSWGSRRFYSWPLDANLVPTNADVTPEDLRVANPANYIDYQDCHYMAGNLALCAGLVSYRMNPDAPSFPLGGVELVDVVAGHAVYQLPVQLWTESGRVMTQNPFWAEATETGMRFYFIPEDDQSRLYIYDVTP